jgi:predicted RNase H-like nuclease (RuvC/YqgF family)
MSGKPSTFDEDVSDMEIANTRDIILKLKAVRAKNNLTISEILSRLDAAGLALSESTVRRIFREGSEDEDGFIYARTIKPVADVLLDENDESADDAALLEKNEALHAIIKEKNRAIETLQEKLDAAEKSVDELKLQLDSFRKEYDLRLRFLRDQIELKDKRMDEKDEIIKRLMDKCL